MYVQTVLERSGVKMNRNETYELDLPDNGLLMGLHLFLSGDEVSGYGATGGDWRLIDEISKIEILANASTPLKSFTGREAQLAAFWHSGKTAGDVWRNYASNTQFASVLVPFNRRPGDTRLALDLSRYNNVKLRVTNTATSSDFSDTLAITVLAQYLRDVSPGSILGFLKTVEYKSWLTVQNAWDYNKLPSEEIIRRIFLQSDPAHGTNSKADTSFFNLCDDIRLALRSRTVDVYRGSGAHYMRLQHYSTPGEVMTGGLLYGTADYGFRFDVGYPYQWFGIAGSKDDAVAGTLPTIDVGETADTIKPETYEGDSPIAMNVRGQGYMNGLMFPFDYEDDPSTWLIPEVVRDVTLDVHTRDSSSADNGYNRIILDTFAP